MNICIPKERRPFEYRVGMTPTGVQILTSEGHVCYVEHDCGLGAGFSDNDYKQAGARIAYSSEEVFGRADLLLKVARPLLDEINWLRPGSILASFLHLSSTRKEKVDALQENRISAIAYEQITRADGSIPIRRPLSEIGGRLCAQIGARLLQNNAGGKGILLGGVPGVPPAEVIILGAGVVGTYAAQALMGMNAHVTVLDDNLEALQSISDRIPGVVTMISNTINVARVCAYADLVIGAVYIPDSPPPIVVTRDILREMKPRTVLMDMSIDEGGCFETSRPTTHENSTFLDEGMIHYCVPNMPSVVARTSTYAFLNAAFPYILAIANNSLEHAIEVDPALKSGLRTHHGNLCYPHRFPTKFVTE